MKLQITNQKGNLDLTVDGEGAHLNLHEGETKADFTLGWSDVQAVVNLFGRKLDELAFGPYPKIPIGPQTTDFLRMPAKVQDVH